MTIRKNIAANLAGRLWAAIMNFAFVPVYLRILGTEAYGLIGFFTSLIAVFLFLDMGLSTAINRELARLGESDSERAQGNDLMRTFESVYWPIGLALGLITIASAPWIADYWLRTERLTQAETRTAIQLMGLVIIFRWPVALYSGALLGLQQSVRLNVILVLSATLQAGGAALILWAISPSIVTFFAWQAFASLAQVSILAFAVWSHMKALGRPARFSAELLRGIIGFSAGVAGITVLSVILTQLDKAVLSRTLPLAEFGIYALASSIASTLSIAATSVYNSIFPVFSRLVADNNIPELIKSYHISSQALCILVAPPAATLIIFSQEIMDIYTGNHAISLSTHTLLSILTAGNALLTFMLLPLALQLAYGWVKLSLYKNIFAVLIYVPLLLFMTYKFGAIGAALVWLALTSAYFFLEVPVMHMRLLKSEKWRWYLVDLASPAAAACVPVVIARVLMPEQMSAPRELGVICLAGVCSFMGAILAATHVRHWLRAHLRPDSSP